MLSPLIRIIAAVVAITPVIAQEAVFSSPVLGYVFDWSSKSVGAITGVPGAAALGEALRLDRAFTRACVNGETGTAVTVTKAGSAGLIRFSSGAATVIELDPDFATPEHCAIAGNSAVVSNRSTVQVWDLGGAWPRVRAMYTSADLGGSPGEVAAARNGDWAVLLPDAGTALEFQSGGRRSTGEVAAIAYAGDGLVQLMRDGRLTDGRTGAVLGQGFDPDSVLAGGATAAVLLNASTGHVRLLRLAGGESAEIESDCRGCHVERVGAGDSFYLSDATGGSLLNAGASVTLERIRALTGVGQ